MSSARSAPNSGGAPVTGFAAGNCAVAAWSWSRSGPGRPFFGPPIGRSVKLPEGHDERESVAVRGFLTGVRNAASGTG